MFCVKIEFITYSTNPVPQSSREYYIPLIIIEGMALSVNIAQLFANNTVDSRFLILYICIIKFAPFFIN